MIKPRVLEEVDSPINGKLTVVKDLAWGTYIKAGGLTQSGGIAKNVSKTAIKKIKGRGFKVDNALILGLGGGSTAGLIKKYFKNANVTGVDLDPLMVELGKKYLGLSEEVKIEIEDAFEYLKTLSSKSKPQKFDLVFIDLYVGDKIPEKFEKKVFLRAVKGVLKGGGVAVFNRLYYGEKRIEAVKFGKMLESEFKEVKAILPEANVVFLCT